MMMSLILEQEEIITELANHNRHLLNLLAQYMEVEEEEAKLKGIIEGAKEGTDNELDS